MAEEAKRKVQRSGVQGQQWCHLWSTSQGLSFSFTVTSQAHFTGEKMEGC